MTQQRASSEVYPLQDQDTTELTLRVADSRAEWAALTGLIDRFADRYTHPITSRQYRAELSALFVSAGVTHPRLLTEAVVNQWVAQAKTNNTLRGRMTRTVVFLRWCARQGDADPRLVEDLQDRENPLRGIPPLYGKVQGKYPARWLTYEEAFERLLGTCDDSDLGRRDELVLRLGLSGMRVAEIVHLVVGDLHFGVEPTIVWIGKKNRARKVAIGADFLDLLNDYLGRYRAALGRPLTRKDPVVCRQKTGGGVGQVSWGNPYKQTCSVAQLVKVKAEQAGLGHMSPHDLRRSAAGILHQAVTEDGAHFFDLPDIQKVLGHTNPATTMRSYIDPIETEVIRRAAKVLD